MAPIWKPGCNSGAAHTHTHAYRYKRKHMHMCTCTHARARTHMNKNTNNRAGGGGLGDDTHGLPFLLGRQAPFLYRGKAPDTGGRLPSRLQVRRLCARQVVAARAMWLRTGTRCHAVAKGAYGSLRGQRVQVTRLPTSHANHAAPCRRLSWHATVLCLVACCVVLQGAAWEASDLIFLSRCKRILIQDYSLPDAPTL